MASSICYFEYDAKRPVVLNWGPQEINQGATGHWIKNPLFGEWKFGVKSNRTEVKTFFFFRSLMEIREKNPSDLW